MTRSLTFGLCLGLALATVGCQDDRNEPTAPATASPDLKQQKLSLPAHIRNQKERGELRLPRGVRVTDLEGHGLARRVIDPDDHVCPASTPVIDWFIGEVNEFVNEEPVIFDFIFNVVWADLIPQWEALFLLEPNRSQEYGYDGEFTNVLRRTDRDARRFWDINTSDLQMVPMKGTMLQDAARVAATYELRGDPAVLRPLTADAATVAGLVRSAILASNVVDGGNHPLFSFNAFAFSDLDGPLPDKIVMGDGVLEGYKVVGFGDVAPQAVYAHEFGHHIQFQNGYFEDPVAGRHHRGRAHPVYRADGRRVFGVLPHAQARRRDEPEAGDAVPPGVLPDRRLRVRQPRPSRDAESADARGGARLQRRGRGAEAGPHPVVRAVPRSVRGGVPQPGGARRNLRTIGTSPSPPRRRRRPGGVPDDTPATKPTRTAQNPYRNPSRTRQRVSSTSTSRGRGPRT